jgi:hypothetical protein
LFGLREVTRGKEKAVKVKDLVAEIEANGGSVRKGTCHMKVFGKDGRMVAVFPKRGLRGPGRHKANSIGTLRRAGLLDAKQKRSLS